MELHFNIKWKLYKWKIQHLKWIILSRLAWDGRWQINGLWTLIQTNRNNQVLETEKIENEQRRGNLWKIIKQYNIY